MLYTLVENCRLGINARDYFEDVLTRLPSMMQREAVSLTPVNWLKARSGKRRTKRPEFQTVRELETMIVVCLS